MCSWAVSHYHKVSSCFSYLCNCFNIWKSSAFLVFSCLAGFSNISCNVNNYCAPIGCISNSSSVLMVMPWKYTSEQQLLWATRCTLRDLCPLSSCFIFARAGMQYCSQEVTTCYHVLRHPEENAARPINRLRPLHFPPPELSFPAATLITLTLSQPGLLFPVESDGAAD